MALDIGPGLTQWCQDHQATPLESEVYPWPDVNISVLPIAIGNSRGQTVNTIVGWDNNNHAILEPGPGVVVSTGPPPAEPPPSNLDPTLTAWAKVVLNDLGEPGTMEQITLLVAQARCEGGLDHNNPANVAGWWNGSTGTWAGMTGLFNQLGSPGFGVAIFDDLVHAAHATAAVLSQGNMADMLQGLHDGNAQEWVNGIAKDPWGTSAACVGAILGV